MNDMAQLMPASGSLTLSLSHGTLETRDLVAARRFYNEFLGLETVQRGEMAIWLRCGGGWMVAAVNTGDTMLPLPPDVRWCLDMGSVAEVEAGHAAALCLKDEYGMQEVREVTRDGDQTGFLLRDMDSNWWEICHRPGRLFDGVFGTAA
jgi:catechol 2,3-dioxygenase-like lactoylglutathione lyase family enzyme